MHKWILVAAPPVGAWVGLSSCQ